MKSIKKHEETVGYVKGEREAKATFFVATNGNDNWSGKLFEPSAKETDGPFATLIRARDAIREAKNEPQRPVTVMVRSGKYYLDQTLVLCPQDGGKRESPVIYTSYPGEKPIISGGRKVAGWKPYKRNIIQCELPEAKGGKWKFRQLFFNGQRQVRARCPKFDPINPLYGGWSFIEGPADNGSISGSSFPGGFTNMVDRSYEGGDASAFKYKPGTFKHHWSKPSEGEVSLFPGAQWGNNIIPIKAIDEEKRIITLQREIWQFDRTHWYRRFSFIPNNRFYVENILEELTEPGEWCLDSEDGILYFWPPTDSIEGQEVVVPALDCLISIRGASWITISGFTLTETLDGDDVQRDGLDGYGAMFPRQGWRYCGEALHLRRAEHCRIENNHFYAVGGNAIYLEGENLRNVVQHNEIRYTGANGICVVGSNLLHPMFNQILDNEIHYCGVINKFVAGVFMGVSEGTLVAHNFIHHTPHHGINLGTNGLGRNIIEYNEIRYTCMETHDTGAVNCWMDMSTLGIKKEAERAGHIIRYNLIADTFGCRVDDSGKMVAPIKETLGIYLDDCSSNCFVYGNIILRVGYAIQVHLGKNNCIENNIAVDCSSLVLYADTVSKRSGNAHMSNFMTGNRTCKNILYTDYPGAVLFTLNKWTDREIDLSDENIFFNKSSDRYEIGGSAFAEPIPLAEWQKWGYDRHSVIADPLFVDSQHDDYRLKPESPAFKLGFQPIDITKIGLRKK